jgi:hypothetical protein
MKKIILFVLVAVIVLSVSVSAYAVTPALKVPSMPKVPTIKTVEIKLPNNFWDNFTFNFWKNSND